MSPYSLFARALKENWHSILIIAAIIVISYFLFELSKDSSRFSSLGFVGIMIVSFLATASLFLPAPGVILIVLLITASRNLLIGSAFAAGGAALGELVAYALGYYAKDIVEHVKSAEKIFGKGRVLDMFSRWQYLFIFVFTLIPNPFFDAIGVLAGYLKLDIKKYFAIVFAGKLLQFISLALLLELGVNAVHVFF